MVLTKTSNIGALLRKDLLENSKNRTIIIVFLTPVILSLILTLSFRFKDFRTPQIAAVGEGGGFRDFLSGSRALRIIPVRDKEEGMNLLRDGRVSAILLLPEDFREQIQRKKKPTLEMVVDESSVTSSVRV